MATRSMIVRMSGNATFDDGTSGTFGAVYDGRIHNILPGVSGPEVLSDSELATEVNNALVGAIINGLPLNLATKIKTAQIMVLTITVALDDETNRSVALINEFDSTRIVGDDTVWNLVASDADQAAILNTVLNNAVGTDSVLTFDAA